MLEYRTRPRTLRGSLVRELSEWKLLLGPTSPSRCLCLSLLWVMPCPPSSHACKSQTTDRCQHSRHTCHKQREEDPSPRWLNPPGALIQQGPGCRNQHQGAHDAGELCDLAAGVGDPHCLGHVHPDHAGRHTCRGPHPAAEMEGLSTFAMTISVEASEFGGGGGGGGSLNAT